MDKKVRTWAKQMQSDLLNATSYMIPFAVVGGVCYSFSLLVPDVGTAEIFNRIGQAGLHLFLPVFGGFIAYSMEDRPGLAPGFLGAYLAQDMGAGFLGGILAGFLGGYTIRLLKKIPIPETYRTVQNIFLFPIGGTVLTGTIILILLGQPIATFQTWMTMRLMALSKAAKIPLGILIGAMVGSDLGGPINKAAYTFAQSQVDTLPFLMGGVGIAGAVPPIGSGFATILFRRKFSDVEIQSGKSAIVMGCMGITEGAIPFLMIDPIRTVLIYMIGSAVGCTVGFTFGCLNHTAWGGLIVLPVVEHRIAYVFATLTGAMVVAILMGILKKEEGKQEVVKEEPADDDWDLNIEDW